MAAILNGVIGAGRHWRAASAKRHNGKVTPEGEGRGWGVLSAFQHPPTALNAHQKFR